MGEKRHGYGFETRMLHAGAQPDPITGARQTPIYQSSAYVFHDADHEPLVYLRGGYRRVHTDAPSDEVGHATPAGDRAL